MATGGSGANRVELALIVRAPPPPRVPAQPPGGGFPRTPRDTTVSSRRQQLLQSALLHTAQCPRSMADRIGDLERRIDEACIQRLAARDEAALYCVHARHARAELRAALRATYCMYSRNDV